MEQSIVFASGNLHKYREMCGFLASLERPLLFGGDLGTLSVEENGNSYEENALLKAKAWSAFTGYSAVADDSGLEVEALAGRPGIYSARQGNNDRERLSWLLGALKGKVNRSARFVAALAYWDAKKERKILVRGICEGTIAENPQGEEGFGYDPVFIPQGYSKTLAVLGEKVKSQLSHRSNAAKALLAVLKNENMV